MRSENFSCVLTGPSTAGMLDALVVGECPTASEVPAPLHRRPATGEIGSERRSFAWEEF